MPFPIALRLTRTPAFLAMALILAPLKVAAQEQAQPASPRLSVELNGVDAGAAGCRLTFVAGNGLAATLDRVS